MLLSLCNTVVFLLLICQLHSVIYGLCTVYTKVQMVLGIQPSVQMFFTMTSIIQYIWLKILTICTVAISQTARSFEPSMILHKYRRLFFGVICTITISQMTRDYEPSVQKICTDGSKPVCTNLICTYSFPQTVQKTVLHGVSEPSVKIIFQ